MAAIYIYVFTQSISFQMKIWIQIQTIWRSKSLIFDRLQVQTNQTVAYSSLTTHIPAFKLHQSLHTKIKNNLRCILRTSNPQKGRYLDKNLRKFSSLSKLNNFW